MLNVFYFCELINIDFSMTVDCLPFVFVLISLAALFTIHSNPNSHKQMSEQVSGGIPMEQYTSQQYKENKPLCKCHWCILSMPDEAIGERSRHTIKSMAMQSDKLQRKVNQWCLNVWGWQGERSWKTRR